MHVTGDLGFSSLVLVVSFVFPVIALIIRRKWRLAVARKEEIKRLLILASEEDARAEFEASVEYGTVPVQRYYQCAVCFSPTTTRCAQCKAVRYCSGKCQIVHWRQGHKDECRPPSISHEINDTGDSTSQKIAEHDQSEAYGDRFKYEDRPPAKPIEMSSEESPLSNACSSTEVPRRKDDEVEVEFHEDKEGVSSVYQSSDASFSGFSASHTSSETSDNVSVCESISSNESEKLDVPLSADISLDTREIASGVKNLDQTNSLSPKFARLVDAVDNFTKLNQVKHIKPGCGGNCECTSTSSSDLGVSCTHESANSEKSTVSSGFWGRTLESKMDACDESAWSNSNGASNSKLFDSRSSKLLSFTLSPPSLSSKASEVTGAAADDTLQASLGEARHTDGLTLSEYKNADAPEVKNSPSLNLKSPVQSVNGTKSGSHVLKSREVESSIIFSSYVPPPSSVGRDSIGSNTLNIDTRPSLSSEKSNNVVNSSDGISDSVRMHSVPSVKSERFDVFSASSDMRSRSESSSSNGRNGLKPSLWKAVDQFRGSEMSKQYSLGVGSEYAGRYKDKGLFSYELFVKLYNWNNLELQPCGLINCGNSCYANSVLQCLAFTPPLTAYFLQGLHSKECAKNEWCFTCELEGLIQKSKDRKSPLSPVGILSQLQSIGSQLGNGREEDAHEFLRYAIDTMQSVCVKEAGVNVSGPLEEETTLMGLTFGGYLYSKIKCLKCQGKSERQERMMDLTVEIDGDITSLEEGLQRFTGTEILDGENKYQCGRCKSYEKAKKKLTIAEAPNILTIALKRFQSGKFGKLNKSIQFPEILNLAPYMSGTSDKLPIYRLYGVVVHLDIMNASFSGHYVCYVKSTQNKWFKVDDSMVAAVEREKVLKEGAYMLLYARCSPRAPRLIRNSIKSHDVKNKVTLPSSVSGKSTISKLKSSSTQSSPGSDPLDSPASIETFYSRFHRLQRILEEDSSSDSSSLISSNSDEGSCSTESTRDSSSADDISDFIFGDSGCGWSNSWRSSSDSDTSSSSSSSLLYSRHSPLTNTVHYFSSCPETSRIQADYAQPGMDLRERRPNRSNRHADLEGTGSDPFLHSDATKQCRKLASSSYRETESERLGRVSAFNDVKSSVIFRKSTKERSD